MLKKFYLLPIKKHISSGVLLPMVEMVYGDACAPEAKPTLQSSLAGCWIGNRNRSTGGSCGGKPACQGLRTRGRSAPLLHISWTPGGCVLISPGRAVRPGGGGKTISSIRPSSRGSKASGRHPDCGTKRRYRRFWRRDQASHAWARFNNPPACRASA